MSGVLQELREARGSGMVTVAAVPGARTLSVLGGSVLRPSESLPTGSQWPLREALCVSPLQLRLAWWWLEGLGWGWGADAPQTSLTHLNLGLRGGWSQREPPPICGVPQL